LYDIIKTGFDFSDKNDARKFFQGLRQVFLEWNSLEWKSDAFSKKESEIKGRLAAMLQKKQ